MKRSFNTRTIYITVATLLTFTLMSCEDQQAIKENDSLKSQIAELEADLEAARSKLGKDPGKQTNALEEVRAALQVSRQELAVNEDAIRIIKSKLEQQKKESNEYMSTYTLR